MTTLSSITSVSLIDESGGVQTLAATHYVLNAAKDTLIFDNIYYGKRVEIVYVAGYGAAGSNIPAPIRQGILAHVAEMYAFRGELDESMPLSAQRFYAAYREVRI